MKTYTASAPNKIHLAGEHSVVYGGWALMAPIEVNGRRNIAELTVTTCPKGKEFITITLPDGHCTLSAGGSFEGNKFYFPMFYAALAALDASSFKLSGSGKKFECKIIYSNSPKGTGNSASVPAAIAAAFYSFAGKVPSKKELFSAAYQVDNAYHGGKSSGGDPQAVVSDEPQLFRKVFSKGAVEFEYKDVPLSLPTGHLLLLVNTCRSGETAKTSDLIAGFAKASGITKLPQELSETQRARITAPFDLLVKEIAGEFKAKGSAQKLAGLLRQNHELLKAAGVSSLDIEACINLAVENGALAGKLIGAGGNGGAVILLLEKARLPKVQKALDGAGFKHYLVKIAAKGACAN